MNDEFIIGKLYQAFLNNSPSDINRRGRKYYISGYQLIEGIFYVLGHGFTWKNDSKFVFWTYKYISTLNRRYNELLKTI